MASFFACSSLSRRSSALFKALPSFALGWAVATPVIAILQGALLLHDYRIHHRERSRPEMPSRGIVIVRPVADPPPRRRRRPSFLPSATPSIFRRRHASQAPPLRILVIGDSLAAGVGQETAIPILPQSIASALSQHLQGRAVYWTCVGTPGLSATEVVEEIHHLHTLIPTTPMIRRLVDWQTEQRIRAQRRLEAIQHETQRQLTSIRQRALFWMQQIGQPVEVEAPSPLHEKDDEQGDHGAPSQTRVQRLSSVIRKRWKRVQLSVQRDLRNFRRIFETASITDEPQAQSLHESTNRTIMATLEEQDEEHNMERRVNRMVRRNSLDPSFVNQYDVAIVLTGLNDLKDSFLPFMMSAQRARMLAQAQARGKSKEVADPRNERTDDENHEGGGRFKGELLRIIRALRNTVLKSLPAHDHESSSNSTDHAHSRSDRVGLERRPSLLQQRTGPLIVFPALPVAPIELSQRAPLSWFVVPIVRGMDRNKQVLAELYPDLVLFVQSPQSTVFSDAEAKRGPLWESFQAETVLLKLTDIAHNVQSRIEELLMTANDNHSVFDEDEASCSLYEMCADSVVLVKRRDSTSSTHKDLDGRNVSRSTHPGATMVAQDGIHPNDQGYELWGKFIARAIVEHWEKEQTLSLVIE